MEDTPRRPGRPKKYVDLVAKTILVEFDLEQDVMAMVEKSGRSFSDICREAIRNGIPRRSHPHHVDDLNCGCPDCVLR